MTAESLSRSAPYVWLVLATALGASAVISLLTGELGGKAVALIGIVAALGMALAALVGIRRHRSALYRPKPEEVWSGGMTEDERVRLRRTVRREIATFSVGSGFGLFVAVWNILNSGDLLVVLLFLTLGLGFGYMAIVWLLVGREASWVARGHLR